MNVKEEKLCRLCLDPVGNYFEVIDKNSREILDMLLMKVNLDISEDPIMCPACSETVNRSYDFKSICNGPKETFIKEETGTDEYFVLCRFCSIAQPLNTTVLVDDLLTEPVVKEIWPIFMPGTELSVIKDSLICTRCQENLGCYVNFVRNCRDIEERINTYCQRNGTNSEGKVNLSSVQPYLIEGVSNYSDKCAIKQEVDVPDLFVPGLKHEELHIKDEDKKDKNGRTDVTKIYNFEAKHERSLKKVKMYKCTVCSYESRHNTTVSRHMLLHKDPSEVTMYECPTCVYKTRIKGNLKTHILLIHESTSDVKIYKCELCTYETKRKSNLEIHMLSHNNSLEVKIHKCALCTYTTNRKNNLRIHMLIHKHASEVEIYKCTQCTYKTKRKRHLKDHMLIHTSASEVQTHRCALCFFETKYKGSLKKHMIVHRDDSELEMYKCTLCNHETKHKYLLKKHILKHKDVSGMYKCTLCNYETKCKGSLESHIVTHEDTSDVVLFKCTLCPYKAKRKGDLKRHMLIHKDSS